MGALMPFAALAWPTGVASAGWRGAAVPTGLFVLARTLTRGLSGGAAIVVTRRWRIGFAADRNGLRVAGEQIFADVSAPPSLASLAAIESARDESGLFPMTLDHQGLIRQLGADGDGAALVRALDTGRALVMAMPISAADRRDADAFMARLAALSAEAVSRLPSDLLFPRAGSDTTSRELALPGGGTGSVTVRTTASACPDSGLLRASERLVLTRIEKNERSSSERWTLTAP